MSEAHIRTMLTNWQEFQELLETFGERLMDLHTAKWNGSGFVENITVDNDQIDVHYNWHVCGNNDHESVSGPIEWLWADDWEPLYHESVREQKRLQAEKEARDQAAKDVYAARERYKTFLRLQAEFEPGYDK